MIYHVPKCHDHKCHNSVNNLIFVNGRKFLGSYLVSDKFLPKSDKANPRIYDLLPTITANLEIFLRILFSPIVLKGIFATLKIQDFDMIYLHQ